MFDDILERKKLLYTIYIKKKSLKRPKIEIFPSFSYRHNRLVKCVSRYSRKKKYFSREKKSCSKLHKQRVKQNEKLGFFQHFFVHSFGQKI